MASMNPIFVNYVSSGFLIFLCAAGFAKIDSPRINDRSMGFEQQPVKM
jgi:hypothetical protein